MIKVHIIWMQNFPLFCFPVSRGILLKRDLNNTSKVKIKGSTESPGRRPWDRSLVGIRDAASWVELRLGNITGGSSRQACCWWCPWAMPGLGVDVEVPLLSREMVPGEVVSNLARTADAAPGPYCAIQGSDGVISCWQR